MNKNAIFVLLLCIVFSPFVSAQGEEFLHAERRRGIAQGVFFREHWAEFGAEISNSSGRMLRVNDAELSLHEVYGKRPEDLFELPRCGLASQSRRKYVDVTQ